MTKRQTVWLKFSGEGRGGDTFETPSPYEQLLPLPTPCFKMFGKIPLWPPTTPLQASFTATPHPIHHPFPLKILIIHKLHIYRRPEKFIVSLWGHLLTKILKTLHKDLPYDCIWPHLVWFGLDKGGEVKRGAEYPLPGQRDFGILAWTGLNVYNIAI